MSVVTSHAIGFDTDTKRVRIPGNILSSIPLTGLFLQEANIRNGVLRFLQSVRSTSMSKRYIKSLLCLLFNRPLPVLAKYERPAGVSVMLLSVIVFLEFIRISSIGEITS